MSEYSAVSDVFRRFRKFSEPILAAVIFMATLAAITRFWGVYQYDADEAYNLIVRPRSRGLLPVFANMERPAACSGVGPDPHTVALSR